MEFSITCPIDGAVDVSLEDIDTVVLKDAEHADITFLCPHCGTEITVSAVVPSFLLSAIEALAQEGDSTMLGGMNVIDIPTEPVTADELADVVLLADSEDSRSDAYCEYFRRQLESIDCVEDALHEMDARG